MSRAVTKTLSFPVAGIARRSNYRRQERPYATPYALNVRGVGSLERRERGGSRPGLTKFCSTDFGASITAVDSVTAIDAAGARQRYIVVVAGGVLYSVKGAVATELEADLLWPDGEVMWWDDGEAVVFDSTVTDANPITDTGAHHTAEHGGKLYLADSTLSAYDPVEGVVSTISGAPTGLSLICSYRDRLILSGTHLWYASRAGDFTDWDTGQTMEDASRPIAGSVSFAGIIGQPIKAIIPYRDYALIFACENSLWVLIGDPATGTLKNLSSEVGIIAPNAWALSPNGILAFLSNDGIYVGGVTESPTRFSDEKVPNSLREVDVSAIDVAMEYSMKERGFNLFAGADNCWFLDVENKAMWKDSYDTTHVPVASALTDGGGLRQVILGCPDGYLRSYSESSKTDDSVVFHSKVVFGPFRIAPDDVRSAILTEIHGIMADNSGSVKWTVFLGDSAEAVADRSESDTKSDSGGLWVRENNHVSRPRVRGAWCCIRLDSISLWSYESIAIVARQLGRLR